ncbi:hypothetical protein Ahy_A03g011915 [Arachis hypogaea]|uniref:Ubiquitin-like protease family profile domain-containing protein n=1 Tax=Arachis hypogaea TaxID=3818 RepID=A0A445DS43_ARAHY|nr:hypothetical protein Ahy_A03g011915 [Arachis hypogaea]
MKKLQKEPPPKPKESTLTLPPAPSKMSSRSNPAPKVAAALMMMARTASYIPKEEAATQEGERAKTPETPKLIEQLGELVEKIAGSRVKTEGKSPQIQKQSDEESFEKFETPARTNEMSAEMKEKCYIWATRVKTYRDGSTNEYDAVCTLNAQDRYILSKVYFASLKADTHIEAEIVSAMCLILNPQNIKRFQEEIYCLPPDIVVRCTSTNLGCIFCIHLGVFSVFIWNMAIGNNPNGEFLQPKTNKPFRVEDYPMFIPFLDLKKLESHPCIFAPVCYSNHWWLWVADARKKKFYILDPYHKTCPSDARMNLNKFIVRICNFKNETICWGTPLKRKDQKIEPPYINISGQKISYDCAIYVMNWLEIIHPENVKREKYKYDNWTEDEVDYYRVEYASRILFHEMNQDKAEAIRGSDAIRLSKPSSLLLSPYC